MDRLTRLREIFRDDPRIKALDPAPARQAGFNLSAGPSSTSFTSTALP